MRGFLKLILGPLFCWCLLGCQPSAQDLVTQAERDALNQRSELARHLYVQVIRGHASKDQARKRAIVGLIDLSLTQLHDYRLALQMMDLAIQEFGANDLFRDLRLRAAYAARLQTQELERAMKYLEPLVNRPDLSPLEIQEIGRVQGALRQFADAEASLKKAWDLAVSQKICREAREIQMDLMQVYSLQKKCPEGIEVGKRSLFEGCTRDSYSINLEMAQCYEFEGEAQEAIRIYEDMLKERPENSRIQFLLANVKKRQKEKQVK